MYLVPGGVLSLGWVSGPGGVFGPGVVWSGVWSGPGGSGPGGSGLGGSGQRGVWGVTPQFFFLILFLFLFFFDFFYLFFGGILFFGFFLTVFFYVLLISLGIPPPPPPQSRLRHMVNEWPVRILLECILVYCLLFLSKRRVMQRTAVLDFCTKQSALE